MFTLNDSIFAVLHSCREDLCSSRLTCYMYMFQLAGLDYQFRYNISTSGIKSRGVDSLLSSMINEDKVNTVNGSISLTEMGTLYYTSIPLTYKEWEKFDNVKDCLDSLSDTELYFVVLTDMVVSDTLNKKGVSSMITGRDMIEHTLASLSKEYSEDYFNSAL